MRSQAPVKLNVCVLPPPDTTQAIVKLASQLSPAGQLFRVDGHLRLPHLTLFMAAFPASAVDDVVARLERLPRRDPITCTAHGLTISSNGYVEVGYNRSNSLEELQVSIAAAIAGLRIVQDDRPDENMSELEAASDRAYGYKLFGEAYRPHVTLAAYAGAGEVTLPLVGDFSEFDFSFATLTLGESDDHGTVARLLHKLPIR